MAYSATVIPVMIASPGDVAEEREVIREAIHDWNDINAERSSVMLAAVGWDSHSSPELGERPQGLINRRILKNCDLLIGVFWTRLGTPTGKAVSGTVEEIEEHVKCGKPAMIYFSAKPVAPQSIDSEQYSKLRDIEAKWKKQGLVETYDTIDEFRRKLGKHIQICLNKNEYLRQVLRSHSDQPVQQKESSDSGRRSHGTLSVDEKVLLRAASSSDDGTILRMEFLDGQRIQAGNHNFGEEGRRDFMRWNNVLESLVAKGLLVERGFKGQVFELTHEGWSVSDAL